MPKKQFRIVPQKDKQVQESSSSAHPQTDQYAAASRPLLFIYRDVGNVHEARSTVEAQAITAHIARHHRKWRKGQKKVGFHPSLAKILTDHDDAQDAGNCVEEATIFIDITCPHGKAMHLIPGFFVTVNDCSYCVLSVEGLSPFADPNRKIQVNLGSHVDSDLAKLIHLYFQIIFPWVEALQQSWHWPDTIPQLQSSPMLHYAVAAYTSAFFAGLQLGAKGIVLPPATDNSFDKENLWPVPAWLQYQTKCVNLLRAAINESSEETEENIFLTVLLLLRISVLLGDGTSAKMHFDALDRLAETQKSLTWSKAVESSLVKVNIISAYFHSPALVFTDQEDTEKKTTYRMVDHNSEFWEDEFEWNKCQNMMLARLLTWSQEPPTTVMNDLVIERILQMDPNARKIPFESLRHLQECYQLALYMLAWLIGISFDTHNPKICTYVQDLVNRLHCLNIPELWNQAPNALFNILFAGAFASRGFLPRVWFVEQIAKGKINVRYMHELYALLSKFTDPGHIRTVLLEEQLFEILHARGNCNRKLLRPADLYIDQHRGRPSRGQRPFTYTPDLLQISANASSISIQQSEIECQS